MRTLIRAMRMYLTIVCSVCHTLHMFSLTLQNAFVQRQPHMDIQQVKLIHNNFMSRFETACCSSNLSLAVRHWLMQVQWECTRGGCHFVVSTATGQNISCFPPELTSNPRRHATSAGYVACLEPALEGNALGSGFDGQQSLVPARCPSQNESLGAC